MLMDRHFIPSREKETSTYKKQIKKSPFSHTWCRRFPMMIGSRDFCSLLCGNWTIIVAFSTQKMGKYYNRNSHFTKSDFGSFQKSNRWGSNRQEKGSKLNLSHTKRTDTGQYICIASNNIGQPATAQITLRVQCKSNNPSSLSGVYAVVTIFINAFP